MILRAVVLIGLQPGISGFFFNPNLLNSTIHMRKLTESLNYLANPLKSP